jgi:hypothetical protein
MEKVRGQYIRYTHKTSTYIKSSYKRSSYQTASYRTSRIQNVRIQNVQLPNVQLPNIQLQNVQDRIQNVQDTKRPVFVNCKLGTVHTEQGLSRHRDLKGDG